LDRDGTLARAKVRRVSLARQPGSRFHLDQLSQAIPANKYAWRPGAGVRSASEVYVHIANGNFLLLSLTGVKLPAEYFPNLPTGAKGKPATQAVFKRMGELEKTVTDEDAVTRILKSSLDEVRNRFSQLTAAELDRPTDFFGDKTTVRRIYLRIFAHVNEHYGQSIAYARVNGIVPPGLRSPSDVRDVYIESGNTRFRS
jgi:uncharacterized damage-inducible protein DinB